MKNKFYTLYWEDKGEGIKLKIKHLSKKNKIDTQNIIETVCKVDDDLFMGKHQVFFIWSNIEQSFIPFNIPCHDPFIISEGNLKLFNRIGVIDYLLGDYSNNSEQNINIDFNQIKSILKIINNRYNYNAYGNNNEGIIIVRDSFNEIQYFLIYQKGNLSLIKANVSNVRECIEKFYNKLKKIIPNVKLINDKIILLHIGSSMLRLYFDGETIWDKLKISEFNIKVNSLKDHLLNCSSD